MARKKPKSKPPLKGLNQTVFEIGDAVAQVTHAAARIYGAVQAHCDTMDRLHPGSADALREVTGRSYEKMRKATDDVYRL